MKPLPSARSLTLALGLVAALPLAGCGASHEAARLTEPAPVAARLATAARLTAETRTGFAGTVVAAKSAAVSSRVMAMVTAVHVDLGDTVAAGQALVSIDPTAAQGQVAQARGGLAQAEAALTLAKRNLERFEALAASQSASELELDMARMQHEQAAGAVQQARGAVDAASSVARESRVVAPFAGRVAARLVEVGDLAAPGRPLVMIESTVGRRLAVAVPETVARAAALALGQTVAVTLDARPDLGELAGRLAEISPGPDPVSHSYTVKVDLPALDLPAGAAGRALLAAERRDAVAVPRAALIESGGLTLVVVRDGAGQAQSRVVTVGSAGPQGGSGELVEILSGLAGGESVALGLAVAPPAGARIDPIEDAQP
jgi:RND family efflux transporter MFP subunit